MKKIYMIFLAVFLAACAVHGLKSTQLGLRSVELNDEKDIVLANNEFLLKAPGEAVPLQRSYTNAPPLIPHSIKDFLPITADNNACISCHDKAVAASMNATPMPRTHYTDLRTGVYLGDKMSLRRYNCTQCHVAQSNAKLKVGNTFKPEFKNEWLKHHSNLSQVLGEGE